MAHILHLSLLTLQTKKVTSHRVLQKPMPQILELQQPTCVLQTPGNGVVISRKSFVFMAASLIFHQI